MSREKFKVLIEQVQLIRNDSISPRSESVYIDLSRVRHPVKELVWVVQRYGVVMKSTDKNKDWFFYGMVGKDGFEHYKCPVKDIKLMLSNQTRVPMMPEQYFRRVQPYYHHKCCPREMMFMYSFGLKPEEHSPSGTCNFSIITNPQLVLRMKNSDAENHNSNISIRCYARAYNVLNISCGMATILYSY